MAKANKTTGAGRSAPEPDNLENELIQESEGMGTAPSGNPGHETQSEGTANPEKAATDQGFTEQVTEPEEEVAPMKPAERELPAMIPQPERKLPPIVREFDPREIQGTEEQTGTSSQAPMYQNDPTDISPTDLHEQRLKTYGPDYVVVTRGKLQQVFTRVAWNAIRGDKGGWREAAPVPAEVRAMRAK